MDNELVDRLKQILESKIEKTRSEIRHELHNKAYNDSLQNEIHIFKLEVIVKDKIADLKIRMNKAMHREVTDFIFTKIETLRWVLYIIHSINKGSLIVV